MPISEEALIEYVKPILKAEGYRKNKKRWMKVRDEFTYIFYIQGSCFDKNDYCIRPGILINALPPSLSYGHFWTEIKQTTPEQMLVYDKEASNKTIGRKPRYFVINQVLPSKA